jgi:hypothetical protein
MKIQNENLKDTSLTLRYTHDDNGNRVCVRSDAQGVFEMPEKDARMLLETPGWSEVREARRLDAPPTPPVPPAVAASAPVDDGPDLSKVKTKAEALAIAETFKLEMDAKWTLAKMLVFLKSELFEDESDSGDSSE